MGLSVCEDQGFTTRVFLDVFLSNLLSQGPLLFLEFC